ncbi:MAG: RNA-binding transcriptional accessory protein [gamma proteobacterium symbiont of Lucinoma myriamae]|nr:RNA-binding transcriptional accessory protein [gamma proteobacterium symbiont of Lucinoma myriamae]
MLTPISQRIAQELNVNLSQVEATITLLDGGDTVPFIARYRKEVTGSLDDSQLRLLDERLIYLRELDERRMVILNTIEEQGKLTAVLKTSLLTAETKTRLEDLYKPYKVKRRTKAQLAREAGLEPLADSLLNDPTLAPDSYSVQFINQAPDQENNIATVKDALDGAKQILMERFAENPELIGDLRESLWKNGLMVSKVVAGQEEAGSKFSDYFDTQEKLEDMPSHRILALFRGRKEGYLTINSELDDDLTKANPQALSLMEHKIAHFFGIEDQGRPADKWLQEVVKWTWKIKVKTSLDMDLKKRLRENADEAAIDVFGKNLNDLLLASPAGQKVTIGLDPGLRTGVKVVVVDETGKFLDDATIYPHVPRNQWDQSLHVLSALAKKYNATLISIGNGTASRETDKLATDLIKQNPELRLNKIVVSEAGASVYSASELASKEFPDLDVSLRGAVSIARRLQDPLAELVKIDPKSIGVGQYQHDVSQTQLTKKLETIVEDCVNGVGVDLNTASVPLLTQVSGLSRTLAANIVAYREQHGAFKNRKELLKVSRLGDKAFEQSAGFLRVMNGTNPLDSSAVHPEAYPLVEKIVTNTSRDIRHLIGDRHFLKSLNPTDYIDESFGEPTVRDIIKELEKPGRDPRPEFKTAEFKEGVEEPKDLKPDMILEGVVTNVTNFGAFIDIGVHQDGLVHISQLADKFVKDPRDVVKAGDVVKAKVVEVDLKRNRIALTMRLNDKPEAAPRAIKETAVSKRQRKKITQSNKAAPANNAMAAAFAKLKS